MGVDKPYIVGDLLGVVVSHERNGVAVMSGAASAEGDIIVIRLTGVFQLPKTTSQAWATRNAKVYWSGTAVTTTASTNVEIGWVYEPALSADAVGWVKLKG